MIPRESDFTKNQANSTGGDTSKFSSKASSSSTASWSRWKDPRIVRMSRALGGKDRHSKVYTVRGLRDRRVRLSVSTAIQLYDLQDRLGLSQPSKVVDWLLDAAKEGIDELPPLQIPQGGFSQHLQQALASHEFQSDKQGLKISGGSVNWNDPFKHSSSSITGGKSKDNVSGESSNKGEANWARNTEEERPLSHLESQGEYIVSTNTFLSRPNPSSLPGLCNPFVRWDPSNLTLFPPPRSLGSIGQPDQDVHSFNLMQLPPTQMSVIPSGSHQVLVYQPGITTQPYFPSHLASMSTEFDPKQMNFQGSELSNSSVTPSVYHLTTQPAVRSFPFSITPNLLSSLKHASSEQINRDDFPS